MANFRALTSLLAYTPTASSEDTNFPATNLAVYADLQAAWKALVATGIVNVTLDLGSGNTLSALAANPGIFIDDINVTSIRIQANSVTTDWVTPPWDQAVTVGKHKAIGRYKGFWRFADLNAAAVAYRYVNIRIVSQTPTDAANYRISRAALGQITEYTANPSYGSDLTRMRATRNTDLADGGVEVNLMGQPYAVLTFPHTLSGATARDEHWDLEAIDEGQPFVLWDASEGASQDAWMLMRLDPSRLSKEFNLYYKTVRAYREVI